MNGDVNYKADSKTRYPLMKITRIVSMTSSVHVAMGEFVFSSLKKRTNFPSDTQNMHLTTTNGKVIILRDQCLTDVTMFVLFVMLSNNGPSLVTLDCITRISHAMTPFSPLAFHSHFLCIIWNRDIRSVVPTTLEYAQWSLIQQVHLLLRRINSLRPRQMNAISQTTFSNAFSWMKIFEFLLKFHWSLFPRVQLTIFQQWFR